MRSHPRDTPSLLDRANWLSPIRIAGTPDEVARDVRLRSLAKLNNVVYVGAYLRRRPTRTKKSARAQRAA